MASRQPMAACRHCGRAVVACITRPLPHSCPPPGHGFVHYTSRQHRCGPQAPATYAQPESPGGST
jgi:hypothetical protein